MNTLPDQNYSREPNRKRKKTKGGVRGKKHTGVLVGVEVVEVVRLLTKANAGGAIAELLNQKGVVLLHDLPDQLPRNSRHLQPKKPDPESCR